jgi:hypothetical protein
MTRSWVAAMCKKCRENDLPGQFIENEDGVECYVLHFLSQEQNRRVELAVDEVFKAARCIGSERDFVLRINWPLNEDEVIELERRVKEIHEVLEDAILKAESDARDGEELSDCLGQLSLSNGTRAGEGQGSILGGRLLTSRENLIWVGIQDDEDLAAELERVLLL